MTTTYNATIELDDRGRKPRDLDQVERLLDELVNYHAVVAASPTGRVELIITLPAETLEQAAATAVDVVRGAGRRAGYAAAEPVSLQVMTTADFDARAGFEAMPDLIGSADAAELIGVSRQRVKQLVDAGALQGEHVGRALVLPLAAVQAFAARDRGPGRPKAVR